MYTRITNSSVAIYDGVTNKFIGEARFDLSPEAEKALLGLVNYGKTPEALLITNLELYQPSPDYIPPTPYQSYKREGVFRGSFTEESSKELVPIEIRFKYNARARGNSTGNLYFFESANFDHIEIESINEILP